MRIFHHAKFFFVLAKLFFEELCLCNGKRLKRDLALNIVIISLKYAIYVVFNDFNDQIL